jgi:hypothetical protein
MDVVVVNIESRPVVSRDTAQFTHGDLLDGIALVELPERDAEIVFCVVNGIVSIH